MCRWQSHAGTDDAQGLAQFSRMRRRPQLHKFVAVHARLARGLRQFEVFNRAGRQAIVAASDKRTAGIDNFLKQLKVTQAAVNDIEIVGGEVFFQRAAFVAVARGNIHAAGHALQYIELQMRFESWRRTRARAILPKIRSHAGKIRPECSVERDE